MSTPPGSGWVAARGRRAGVPREHGPAVARGFTMVELIVVLALMMLVFVCVWQSFAAQRDTFRAQEQMSDIQQNLRVAMDAILRDVRMAGLRAPQGVGPILQAGPFQLILFADSNGTCLCGTDLPGAAGSFRIQLAEDACWGAGASFGETLSATHNWATDHCASNICCPLPAWAAGMPGTDTPMGIQWYSTYNISTEDAQFAHAEIVGWTMDRPPSATDTADADPLKLNTNNRFETLDHSALSLVAGDCGGGTSKINLTDRDPDLSLPTHALFNIYRYTHRNPAGTAGNQTSSSRVASGLIGPCDTNPPQDDLGNRWPLFAYWVDQGNGTTTSLDGKITNNCDGSLSAGEDVMWGDDGTGGGTAGNCLFEAGEYSALEPVGCTNPDSETNCDLKNIVRVDVHLRAESAQVAVDVAGATYRFRYLEGSAWVRTARGREQE